MIYCKCPSSCEYASIYPTVSGTIPKFRKEMDDFLAQEKENKNNYQYESLFKKIVNYVFTK